MSVGTGTKVAHVRGGAEARVRKEAKAELT